MNRIAGGVWAFLLLPAAQDRVKVEDLVELRAEAAADAAVAGRPLPVALELRIRPGWHVYWRNPGSSGMAPEIELRLPEGFRAGPVRWPRPRRFGPAREPVYGYEGRAVFFVSVVPPEGRPADLADLEVHVTAMVCKEACLLGTFRARVAPPAAGNAARWAADLEALPRPLSEAAGVRAEWREGTLTVSGPAGRFREVRFFPDERPGVRFGTPEAEIREGSFRLSVPAAVRPDETGGKPPVVAGLVALGEGDRDPSYEIQVVVSSKD
ncbi:MAG TPA: protein-disulfide reductase DsbD domain-containing protein [Planctomycetota bacterium]|nr:protein-disulfide reductase DsbD domain-containing protein [Planctomycetota bacterium]